MTGLKKFFFKEEFEAAEERARVVAKLQQSVFHFSLRTKGFEKALARAEKSLRQAKTDLNRLAARVTKLENDKKTKKKRSEGANRRD